MSVFQDERQPEEEEARYQNGAFDNNSLRRQRKSLALTVPAPPNKRC